MSAYIDNRQDHPVSQKLPATCQKESAFSGRATRSEFWFFTLVSTLLIMGAWGLDAVLVRPWSPIAIISAIVAFAHYIPSIAVLARRLHDIDRTGLWYFFMLVPIIGIITMLVFLCTRSTPGSNRFGPPQGGQAAIPVSDLARG